MRPIKFTMVCSKIFSVDFFFIHDTFPLNLWFLSSDIDECEEGLVTCGRDRRCKNTYGDYMCICREGYRFNYINGRLKCVRKYGRWFILATHKMVDLFVIVMIIMLPW